MSKARAVSIANSDPIATAMAQRRKRRAPSGVSETCCVFFIVIPRGSMSLFTARTAVRSRETVGVGSAPADDFLGREIQDSGEELPVRLVVLPREARIAVVGE